MNEAQGRPIGVARSICESKGVTLEQVTSSTGRSLMTLHNWAKGRSSDPETQKSSKRKKQDLFLFLAAVDATAKALTKTEGNNE